MAAPDHTPPSGSTPAERARTGSRRGALVRVLDLLSSVRLGIAILALLFVYMSIGSAGYVIRQTRWFEMTEFEWFHWWPFDALVALLCVSLALVTVRKIRLNAVNLGVWMIHVGVITLCVGSVIYFGAKVEGDTPVFRRKVVIESPAHPPVELVAIPGAHAVVGEGDSRRMYEVTQTRPDWPLLTGADAGSKAYSVSVAVTGAPAEGAEGGGFTRQLLDGYPQYTEDVLPGKGRAVKVTGEKLADASLSMRLEPEAQSWFYLVNTWSLFFREARPDGTFGAWSQRTVRGLPRYNDYIASRNDVWPTLDGKALTIDPIDILARPGGADPLGPAGVRVTGYLRYAAMQARYVQGPPGARFNPVAELRLETPGGAARSHTLAAFDPARRVSDDQTFAFLWASSTDEAERIARPRDAALIVTLPGAEPVRLPATAPARGAPEPPFVDVGPAGAGYALRVRELVDNLAMGDGRTLSLAIVDIRTPTGSFTRWVAEDPASTRDFIDTPDGQHSLRAPDPTLGVAYEPAIAAAPVTLVGWPGEGAEPSLALVVSLPGMEPTTSPVRVGETRVLGPQASVTVSSVWPTATQEARPVIVPLTQRDRDAGTNFAMVKVEIDAGGRTESRWLPFHQYVFDDASYVYGGRFRFEPTRFTLPDGRVVEAIFSRERRPLPAPVQLDEFRLVSHVGGFTGEIASIRDWESVIRFREADGTLSDARVVRSNGPAGHRGFRYFQAMWDPPMAEIGSGGLNFTGLGIGNRKGVMIQLAGSILATIGMLYAFYVKPVIKRRRVETVRRAVEAGEFVRPGGASTKGASPVVAIAEPKATVAIGAEDLR